MEIAIVKYGKHFSKIAITEEKLGKATFGFDFTSYEDTVEEVDNFKIRKVPQKTDILVRIIVENIDIVISCIIISITRCHVLPFPLV